MKNNKKGFFFGNLMINFVKYNSLGFKWRTKILTRLLLVQKRFFFIIFVLNSAIRILKFVYKRNTTFLNWICKGWKLNFLICTLTRYENIGLWEETELFVEVKLFTYLKPIRIYFLPLLINKSDYQQIDRIAIWKYHFVRIMTSAFFSKERSYFCNK